ncbi:glycine-rich protein [Kitasatospora sp. NPDC002040]|uniref:glycine-rich protein n=1 Tax=Kitasatospora sp. NPDC002040 TaxID=3154661 RepID=UPI00332C7E12
MTGALAASGLAALVPGTAHAADACVYSSTTRLVTCTFGFTGGSQYWTVPSYVTSATVTAVGAYGGGAAGAGQGAPGGRQDAALTGLTAGQRLQVNVGGTAQDGAGGWNGGARGSAAQGGGGASDVRVAGGQGQYALDGRVLVAGGGGGSGTYAGGAGGGSAGGAGVGNLLSGSGGGATQTAGGSGPGGGAGSFGQGGTRVTAGGFTGGGGGWWGGGGGDSGATTRGGGAGGGSSHVGSANGVGAAPAGSDPGGTAAGGTFTPPTGSRDGLVTISYDPTAEPVNPCRTGDTTTVANGTRVTCTRTYQAAEGIREWIAPTLPDGQQLSLSIDAFGANGGQVSSYSGNATAALGSGGKGGRTAAEYYVTPGTALLISPGRKAVASSAGRGAFAGGSGGDGTLSYPAGDVCGRYGLGSNDFALLCRQSDPAEFLHTQGGGGGAGSFVGLRNGNAIGALLVAAGGGGGASIDNEGADAGDVHNGYNGGDLIHSGSNDQHGPGGDSGTANSSTVSGGGGSGWYGGWPGSNDNGGNGGESRYLSGYDLYPAVYRNQGAGTSTTGLNSTAEGDGYVTLAYTYTHPGKIWTGPVTFRAGDGVTVTGGSKLIMQADGNLVVYTASGTATWASGTVGNPGASAEFGADGNLRIRRADGTGLRRTGVADAAGSLLQFTPAGALRIVRNGVTAWDSGTGAGLPYLDPTGLPNHDAVIAAGTTLAVGTVYRTGTLDNRGNRMSGLVMQGDGNLVSYRLDDNGAVNPGAPLWASGTVGANRTATFTGDGEFRITDATGTRLWGSGTNGGAGSTLRYTDPGTLRIDDAAGRLRWANDSVAPGTRFAIGGMITAGPYRTVLNGDGNLVTYTGTTPVWATNTWGNNGAYAVFDTDGTLQVRKDNDHDGNDGNDQVLWAENGSRANGTVRLTQQGDGNLVAYTAAGQATWASGWSDVRPVITSAATATLTAEDAATGSFTLTANRPTSAVHPGATDAVFLSGPGSSGEWSGCERYFTLTGNGNGSATLARNGTIESHAGEEAPGWYLAQRDTCTLPVTAVNNAGSGSQQLTISYNPYIGR